MLLNLTDLSAEPLQSQIVRHVRAKILTGDLITGADLPSIRRLAREEHLNLDEAAERMGRSREAVKKLYGRALCRFREIFDRMRGGIDG